LVELYDYCDERLSVNQVFVALALQIRKQLLKSLDLKPGLGQTSWGCGHIVQVVRLSFVQLHFLDRAEQIWARNFDEAQLRLLDTVFQDLDHLRAHLILFKNTLDNPLFKSFMDCLSVLLYLI
jgi:hypothetical protein